MTKHLLVKPLYRMQAKFKSLDSDNQEPKCRTLIISGARLEQAIELHAIIEAFKDFPQSWNIIVIGHSYLLHDGGSMPHHDVSTLYLCDNGLSMYSWKDPADSTSLYKVDTPGTVALRILTLHRDYSGFCAKQCGGAQMNIPRGMNRSNHQTSYSCMR
jgi:hypothetical protein